MTLTLARALRFESSGCAAFVGAGGKTTAMFQLARQLQGPVMVTATSHLGAWQIPLADQHIITEIPEPIEAIEDGLQGVILVTGRIEEDRTTPVNDDLLAWLRQFCGYHSIPLLIEADGSRQKPLKAWAEHEPPVPSFADVVVHVAGLGALGRALDAAHVHRPEEFSGLSGLDAGDSISAAALTRVLTHPDGALRRFPEQARRVVVLNQADSADLQAAALGMTPSLSGTYDSVVIASLASERIYATYEPIAGIVLAAGESRRFGRPKQLLDWRGETFVRAVTRKALAAGLSPVVLVTGAHAQAVSDAVSGLAVELAANDQWETGQASSIRAGVEALRDRAGPSRRRQQPGGAIFLLADQPQVSTAVLRALVHKHAEELHAVVAPLVIDQRANPVLFDRDTFADLMSLEGDVGGRAIMHRHRVEYLPWHDDSLLLDVDTPEQYQRMRSDDSL